MAPPDVEKGHRGLEDFGNDAECNLLPTNLFTIILEQRESKRDRPTWVKMFESFGARDMNYSKWLIRLLLKDLRPAEISATLTLQQSGYILLDISSFSSYTKS